MISWYYGLDLLNPGHHMMHFYDWNTLTVWSLDSYGLPVHFCNRLKYFTPQQATVVKLKVLHVLVIGAYPIATNCVKLICCIVSFNITKSSFVFRYQSSWRSRVLPIHIHPEKFYSQRNELYVPFQVHDKIQPYKHQNRKHPLCSCSSAGSVLPKLSVVVHVSPCIKLHCKWWSGNTRLYWDSVKGSVTLLHW